MPRGLPIAYIKKWGISKKAWRKFRAGALTKGVPTRKFKKSQVKKNNPKRRRRNLARRRRKRGRRKFTLPLGPILGLAAGLAPAAQLAMSGDWEGAAKNAVGNYTGYDMDTGKWWAPNMAKGLLPLVIGCLVHKFVGGPPLNVNRMLAAANVPVIRI